MRTLPIAVREFRANWRRNAIFGAILLMAIAVQLVTALSAAASRTAVESYGAAVFGFAETYSLAVDDPVSAGRLAALNGHLDEITGVHPWFRPATAVDVPAQLRTAADVDLSAAAQFTLRAVSPSWRLLTPAIPDDDAWRTVTSDRRLGPAILLDQAAARRLGLTGPRAVTVLLQDTPPTRAQTPSGTAPADAGVATPAHLTALRDVPVFGTYTELNKSLAADGLVNQNVLAHLPAAPARIYWRCEPARCRDALGLARTAVALAGLRPGREQRIDLVDQFRPVLRQQQQDGRTFALVVLVLGGVAVAIVSTAFVEVRAPQFATLRALGASRPVVGAIALLENLFTALVVGVVAVAAGAVAGRVDPDRFNRITEIHLDHLDVPVSVYAQTAALTIVIGLLTGLAPAVRAYRSVRTS